MNEASERKNTCEESLEINEHAGCICHNTEEVDVSKLYLLIKLDLYRLIPLTYPLSAIF